MFVAILPRQVTRPTRLETFAFTRKLPIAEVLNALQDHGIISDLCVTAQDVAPEDEQRALEWLRAAPALPRSDAASKP